METTGSYDNEVKEKHPEIQAEWVERTIANPYYTETREDGRIRYYGIVPEPDKWTRVVVADGKLHNRIIDHKRLGEPLNKSVTWVFILTRRSCKGRNDGPQRFKFLLSQERRGEGAGV